MKHRYLLLLLLAGLALLAGSAGGTPFSAGAGSYQLYLPHAPNHYPLIPLSDNLLPNPSFEEGWYHPGDVAELQIPERWRFAYDDENVPPLDPAPWNVWRRPEVRVLPSQFLPKSEWPLFIWDGVQTLKIFKGFGAISFRLTSDVWLPPGTYLLEIYIYPDLVDHYENGQKVFAPDPLSGEFHFIIGDNEYEWLLPVFGQKNRLGQIFTVDQAGPVTVGAAMRGRWALQNNGWFMDDWSLVRIGGG